MTKMLRVAVLQFPFTFVATPQEFMDWVRSPIEAAAGQGAHLIVLPGYIGYALFGILAPDLAGSRVLDLQAIAAAQHFGSVPAMMQDRVSTVQELYLHIFQSLAERTGTWLVPGTAPGASEEAWYNEAWLVSPDGRIAGHQRQAYRSAGERAAGMAQGTELRVFATEIGRLGLVVGEDIRYPESSRTLALQGANVLVHPAAMPGMGEEQFLVDLWREVQSNQVFGAQANLVGEALRARSAIYAPVEMTSDHRGILVQADTDSQLELLTADLDFAALQKVVDAYPIFDLFNRELYRGLDGQGVK